MPAVVGSVSAADDDPRVPKPNILKNLLPPPSFSIILAGEAAGAAGKELLKTDLPSGNSCLSELASCVFPVSETRSDETNGLKISDKLCTDIASPPFPSPLPQKRLQMAMQTLACTSFWLHKICGKCLITRSMPQNSHSTKNHRQPDDATCERASERSLSTHDKRRELVTTCTSWGNRPRWDPAVRRNTKTRPKQITLP